MPIFYRSKCTSSHSCKRKPKFWTRANLTHKAPNSVRPSPRRLPKLPTRRKTKTKTSSTKPRRPLSQPCVPGAIATRQAPTRTELRDSTSRWENSIKQGVLRHTPEKKTTCQQSRLRPEPARADHWRPKLAAAGRTRGGPATQREQPCVHQISARALSSIALIPDSGAGVQLAQRSPQQRRSIQRRASVVPQRVVGPMPN